MLTDAWLSAAAVVLLFVIALTARCWAPQYIAIGRYGLIFSPAVMRAYQQQHALWSAVPRRPVCGINSTPATDYGAVRRR